MGLFRNENEVFADELIQASVVGEEGKAWRKEFIRLMARGATHPLTLEDAMGQVRAKAVDGKISQEEHEVLTSLLSEEKDRVSLSQWMVNEGIEVLSSAPEAAPTPSEQAAADAVDAVVREPLEREGAKKRVEESTLLEEFKSEKHQRPAPGQVFDFRTKGEYLIGWQDGNIKLTNYEPRDQKFGGAEAFYFQHVRYPDYIIAVAPGKGWKIWRGSELLEDVNGKVKQEEITEYYLRQRLFEVGAQGSVVQALSEEEKKAVEQILKYRFKYPPARIKDALVSEKADTLRWVIQTYGPNAPIKFEKPGDLSKPVQARLLSSRQARLRGM